MAWVSYWIGVVLISVGQAAPGGQASPGGLSVTRVGVVDLPAVSERYLKTSDLESQFELRRTKFNVGRDALRQRIDRTRQSLLEEFKPGTDEYQERRKQLVMLEAELQWFMEAQGRKIEQELANSLRAIFSDIQVLIRELAGHRGIDIVLAADQLPEDAPGTTAQARQQIVLQKVLYWRPSVDLTDEVVARLNAQYKARRATSPGE